MRKEIGYATLFICASVILVTVFTNLIPIGLVADFGTHTADVRSDDPTVTYEITSWQSQPIPGQKRLHYKMHIQPADRATYSLTNYYNGTKVAVLYGTKRASAFYSEQDTEQRIFSRTEREFIDGSLSVLNTSESEEIRNHQKALLGERAITYGKTDTVSEPALEMGLHYPSEYNRVDRVEIEKNRTPLRDSRNADIPSSRGYYYSDTYYSDTNSWTLNRVTIYDWRPALVYTNDNPLWSDESKELVKQVGGSSVAVRRASVGAIIDTIQGGGTEVISAEKSEKTPEHVFEQETQIDPTEIRKMEQPQRMGSFGPYGNEFTLVSETVVQSWDKPFRVTDISGDNLSREPIVDGRGGYKYRSDGEPIEAVIPTGISPTQQQAFAHIWDGLNATTVLGGASNLTVSSSGNSHITYYDEADNTVVVGNSDITDMKNVTISYTQQGVDKTYRAETLSEATSVAIVELPCGKESCQYQNITVRHGAVTAPDARVAVESEPKVHNYVSLEVSNNGERVASYREYIGGYRYSDYEPVDVFDPDYEHIRSYD